jgi:hypothetical protein
MRGAIPPHPNTLSWRGAQLKVKSGIITAKIKFITALVRRFSLQFYEQFQFTL